MLQDYCRLILRLTAKHYLNLLTFKDTHMMPPLIKLLSDKAKVTSKLAIFHFFNELHES